MELPPFPTPSQIADYVWWRQNNSQKDMPKNRPLTLIEVFEREERKYNFSFGDIVKYIGPGHMKGKVGYVTNPSSVGGVQIQFPGIHDEYYAYYHNVERAEYGSIS